MHGSTPLTPCSRNDLSNVEEGGVLIGYIIDDLVKKTIDAIEAHEYNARIKPYAVQRLKDAITNVIDVWYGMVWYSILTHS